MVRLYFLGWFIFGLLLAQLSLAQEPETTTWLIVRHADRAGSDDALTKEGERRADQLADLMKTLRVGAVYSTNTQRTQRTVEPTATALNLSVTKYGALSDAWFDQIKSKHRGAVVLIVAHSNTAGQIVHGLGSQGDFSLDEDEFDSLFIVTTGDQGSTAVRLKYGDPSGARSD